MGGIFWNGRDCDDPFGKHVEIPNGVEDEHAYMKAEWERHADECKSDPEKRLFVRLGIGHHFYWKFLPDMSAIDTVYYAKQWGMSVEDTRKCLAEDGYPVAEGGVG